MILGGRWGTGGQSMVCTAPPSWFVDVDDAVEPLICAQDLVELGPAR